MTDRKIPKTVGWLDMLVYRLFFWRWDPLLKRRPDLLAIFREAIEGWEKRTGFRTLVRDPLNPRANVQEVMCCVCGEWFDQDDIVWAKPDGTLSTTGPEAMPFCTSDLPEEPEYD